MTQLQPSSQKRNTVAPVGRASRQAPPATSRTSAAKRAEAAAAALLAELPKAKPSEPRPAEPISRASVAKRAQAAASVLIAELPKVLPSEARPAEPIKRKLSPAEQHQLITRYTHLVRQIAGGFQRKLPRNVLRDDLIAAGMSGLWDAIRKHGHDQSGNFDWYVRVRIRGAILDELRAQDWLPRRARAAAAEAALAAGYKGSCAPMVLRFDEVSDSEQARCLVAGESSNTEKTVEARLVNATLTKAMDLLPERERRIVSMHYFRGIRFKDLGEMLGVSEPRISQLHSRAMNRLKVLLENAA